MHKGIKPGGGMKMTKAPAKAAALLGAQQEANTPKSRLMDICKRLRRDGLNADANRLDRIIGSLEAWQNKR